MENVEVKVAITGGYGFLGWHTACRLLATRGVDPVRLGRDDFADPARLAEKLVDVDTVVHVAGVNRADTDDHVEEGNITLAERLATALGDRSVHVVYANSVQADGDTAYGRGKRRAGDILAGLPGTLADVALPNLFGEHGRPAYNSFVATFAHEVAQGRRPQVTNDRQISLLHAQDAAEALIAAAERRAAGLFRPEGDTHGVGEVLQLLDEFHALYRVTGEFPDLSSGFRRDLFNTYRTALWPQAYPLFPPCHSDPRGDLVEAFRSHGGTGQGYVSSTRPGQVRGEHYHLRKVERLVVFRGQAEVALRRLFSGEIMRVRVSGENPAIIDLPTMWVHNLRNVGQEDLITAFWADQLLDPDNPDQYLMKVEEAAL
jgi:UDP-2-acetamido-2,6-beta-L-arabino-hexul-4-ose reductase